MKQPWKRSAEAYSGVATSSIYLQNKPRILLLSDAGESDIPYKDRVDELYELTLLSRVEEYFRVEPEALLPDLIIYDYKKNTYDLLLHIRNYVRRHWKYKIPILIIQREPDEQLYGRLIDCGEMEILRAPFREEELIYRIGLHLKGLEKEVLEKRVDKLLDRLSESHLAMILALAELTESRDKSTGNHLQRIRSYSKLLARKLMERDLFPEIDADFLRHIYHMSALHDIGKVGIPDRILLKEGPLSSEERREMQEHSRIGGRTIEKVLRNYSISGGFEMARDIALYHHERWDGEGYPEGLAREEIPLAARIVAVADVFDALAVRRVYKEAFPMEKVEGIMRLEEGRAFDPRIVSILLDDIGEFEEIMSELGAGVSAKSA